MNLSEIFRVLINALSNLSIRLSGSFATFLVTILITSFLGLTNLGSFVKITSFVTIFYLVIDFGINTIYLRDNFEKAENAFGNLFALRLAISSLVFILLIFLTLVLPGGDNAGFSIYEKVGVFIYSFTIFTEGMLVSFSGLVQKKLLQQLLVVPSIVSSVVVVVIVYLGVIQNNMLIILSSYPIAELTQVILTFFMVKKSILFEVIPKAFMSFSKTTILAASPLALMLFLNVIYFRLDTFVLALFKSNVEVGVYGFSYKVFEFLIAFPTFLGVSIFPILIENKNNKVKLKEKIKSYSIFLLVSSITLAIVTYLFSPILGLLGRNYIPAILPLQILCASLPFFFLTSLFQWVLLLKNRIKILIIIYSITMILNLVLNILYVPQFSYLASAVITVITEVLVFILMIGSFSLTSVKNSSNKHSFSTNKHSFSTNKHSFSSNRNDN